MHTGHPATRQDQPGPSPNPAGSECLPTPHLDHQAPAPVSAGGGRGLPRLLASRWSVHLRSASTAPIIHTAKSSIVFLCFKCSEPVCSPEQIPQEQRVTGFPGQLLAALETPGPQACVYPSPSAACLLFKGSPARSAEARGPNMGELPAPALHPDQGRNQDPRLPLARPRAPVSPEERGHSLFCGRGGRWIQHGAAGSVPAHAYWCTRAHAPPGTHRHAPPGTLTSSGCVPGVGHKRAYVQS